jgi:putative phosphoesterase
MIILGLVGFMKIGLIADPHSNLAAFKAVLEDMPRVDQIICVGDLVGYAAEPNEVIDLVRSKRIQAVMGNHDYAAVTRDVRGFNSLAAQAALWTADKLSKENVKFLSNLPTQLRLDLKKKIYVVHGSPRDHLNEYVFPDYSNRELARAIEGVDAEVVVLGHTHVPMKRMIMGKLIVNPGSVGQPRDRDPRASYAVLTLGEEVGVTYRRTEYDVEVTAGKIKLEGLPEELAARLFFGW